MPLESRYVGALKEHVLARPAIGQLAINVKLQNVAVQQELADAERAPRPVPY